MGFDMISLLLAKDMQVLPSTAPNLIPTKGTSVYLSDLSPSFNQSNWHDFHFICTSLPPVIKNTVV